MLPGFVNRRGWEREMFCPKCGKENSEGAKFCGSCGADIDKFAAPNAAKPAIVAGESMTFVKSISTCLSKYVDFKGRASRPEYWWFYLFTVLLSWGAMIVDSSQMLSGLVSIAVLLPSLAVGARRLHDTNRSGWWLLISLSVIGLIPLIIWLASKGNEQANDYGSPV